MKLGYGLDKLSSGMGEVFLLACESLGIRRLSLHIVQVR